MPATGPYSRAALWRSRRGGARRAGRDRTVGTKLLPKELSSTANTKPPCKDGLSDSRSK